MSYCDDTLQKAKRLKLDECEVVSIQKKITTVRITDSEITEIKQNNEKAIAARMIHEKKILSAKLTPENKEDVLDKILKTSSFIQPNTYWKSLPFPSKFSPVSRTYDLHLSNISGVEATDIANEMINSATHEKITRISGSLNIVSEHFHIMNTNGLDCSDLSTYIAGTINADSDLGITPVSGIGASCSRTLENFLPEEIGNDALEMCEGSINPKSIEQDSYSIIFEPYAFGELLAFVFASNFNLKTYSEKRSCFSDKMKKKIADDKFSLIDDPHSPEGLGSKPFDDEGTPTQPQFLIDSGIFTNVYSDSFYAYKEGMKTTGNASRLGSPMGRSAQPIPVSLPHNLRVVNGSISQDEIIKETKKGLLVGRLWYTYPVNPERGDFSCTARSGIRIIENGEIKSPGKSVRIVNNLQPLLQSIAVIGNNAKNVLQWSALPCITPTVKVDSLSVTPI